MCSFFNISSWRNRKEASFVLLRASLASSFDDHSISLWHHYYHHWHWGGTSLDDLSNNTARFVEHLLKYCTSIPKEIHLKLSIPAGCLTKRFFRWFCFLESNDATIELEEQFQRFWQMLHSLFNDSNEIILWKR